MIKKIFSVASLFSLSSLPIINFCRENESISYKIINTKFSNPRIILNILLSRQEQENYSFFACLQTVFRFYGMTHTNNGVQYSQNYISRQLARLYGSVSYHVEFINWINQQFENAQVEQQYYQHNVPANFGITYDDMRLFQSYVLFSMRQGMPGWWLTKQVVQIIIIQF